MNPHLNLPNYYLEVARGYIPGAITVHKFGHAPVVDAVDVPATIWDGSCENLSGPKIPQYTFSTTADITDIASSSAADTQVIEVQGLDADWKLVVQEVTLTGQTVATLTTPLLRAFRMINKGSTENAGDIYLTTTGAARTLGTPDVGSTVRAIIKTGDGQTQMAIFTVPAGYTMYIAHAWTTMTKASPSSPSSVIVKFYKRSPGGVFRVGHTLNLNTAGSSTDHRPYIIPYKMEEKEDITYRVVNVSANGQGVSAGFHAVLLPNGNR